MMAILVTFFVLTYLINAKNMRDYSEVALWWLCLMSYKGTDKGLTKFSEFSSSEQKEFVEKLTNTGLMAKVYPKVSRYSLLLMLCILVCVGVFGYLSLSTYPILIASIMVVVGVLLSVFIASVTSGFARGNLWIQDIETGRTSAEKVTDSVAQWLRLSVSDIQQFDERLDLALKKGNTGV